MPAPQASLLSQLSKTNFIAQGIKLPLDWKDPGAQYESAFQAGEKQVAPNSPTSLFQQQTLNKYHVDAARDSGEKIEKYIDGICEAICSGIDNWMKMASVAGVVINGPSGSLMPGNVLGPPLAPLILSAAPMNTAQEMKFSNAIANCFGTAWQAWHMGLAGTLLYPSFAAVPMPMAPPTPNVPAALVMLSSAGESMLSANSMKASMQANLGDPQALHASEIFDAIARAFETCFLSFKSTTLLQNILGTGPVPSFAPPVAPVGPVLAGVGNGAPGCMV